MKNYVVDYKRGDSLSNWLENHPCTGYVRRVTHDEIADAVG
jgi:hypothetical protein